ncbi:MAG: OmpA family protein [Deltaproteobacteria bacterium]|nr:OmpA family protein [Deltaproteobacteria bacterium]
MMLVFLSTMLTGCVPQDQYDKVLKQNQELKERVEKMDARIEKQIAEIQDLIKDLKPLIDRGLVSVDVIDGRVTIGMPSDVLFASGSATLSTQGKEAVTDLARALSRRAADHDFQIEGHTDSEAINTAQFPNNWWLGSARSITVLEAMVGAGFPRANISASTYAETQPAASNNDATGRALNRRIDVVMVPDVTGLPGYKRIMEATKGKERRKK